MRPVPPCSPSRALPLPMPARAAGEVNIYSYREPGLINPLLDRLHQRDRHQDERRVRLERSHRAPRRRRQEQPRRPPADPRVRSAAASGRCRRHAADALRRDRQGDPREAARRQGPVVRSDAARARRLRLEGPRQAGCDHLRGARRPEVARQDLHPLRPAHLQRRARRLDDRPPRRGSTPRSGSPASRPTWRAAPPAATAKACATCRPACATSPSATPTTWRRC